MRKNEIENCSAKGTELTKIKLENCNAKGTELTERKLEDLPGIAERPCSSPRTALGVAKKAASAVRPVLH